MRTAHSTANAPRTMSYQATVQAEGKQYEAYIGLSENQFKTRFFQPYKVFKKNPAQKTLNSASMSGA